MRWRKSDSEIGVTEIDAQSSLINTLYTIGVTRFQADKAWFVVMFHLPVIDFVT
jgi:hypothetical protein